MPIFVIPIPNPVNSLRRLPEQSDREPLSLRILLARCTGLREALRAGASVRSLLSNHEALILGSDSLSRQRDCCAVCRNSSGAEMAPDSDILSGLSPKLLRF